MPIKFSSESRAKTSDCRNHLYDRRRIVSREYRRRMMRLYHGSAGGVASEGVLRVSEVPGKFATTVIPPNTFNTPETPNTPDTPVTPRRCFPDSHLAGIYRGRFRRVPQSLDRRRAWFRGRRQARFRRERPFQPQIRRYR